jgi:hypothetical protein
MKYIKKYENIVGDNFIIYKPKVGDYVLMRTSISLDQELKKFINNTIGQIININENENLIKIAYDNVPAGLIGRVGDFDDTWKWKRYIRAFSLQQIVYFDENEELLKLKIQALKYNL